MHFIAEKCCDKWCCNFCFPDPLWRKQFMDGNAGGRNCGIFYQYAVFVPETKVTEKL